MFRSSHNDADRDPRFPATGYVLINMVVIAICALIYFATKGAWFTLPESSIERPAVGALLFFIPVAFIIASIYDYFFDRGAERMPDHRQSADEKDSGEQPKDKDSRKPTRPKEKEKD